MKTPENICPKTYRKLTQSLALITLLFIVSGCFGGGTIGTGLTPTGFGGRKPTSAISFDLVGTLLNTEGTPLANATISIETSYGLVSRKTDGYGRFRAPLSISSGEYIKLEVTYGKEHFSQSQQLSPAGAKEVYQTIKIEPGGSLEIP